ncbi:MAG TPA: MtnX-like HAD-IB family phosphatase [candidate division Zixibacteria bacterium]
MGEPKDFLVLVDFDGTITQKDVGADLFNTYSKEKSQKIVSRWVKGEISSRECLERECQLIKITEAELKKFALRQKIDVKFPTFVDYCKGEHLRLVILSDGLDLYIKLILKKYGLNEVPFYSNVLSFNNGELSLKFPFFDRGCGNCGNCKRYHISRLRGKTKRVIYIGDGLSDKCAVREADFVFAKKDLRKFCEKSDIQHIPYRNFGDIIRILPDVISRV